ncbi:hypothetical protein NJ7G_0969 [Natrinema sp. J7-2]|nr:hypothetical protein NJ7G_0969 [Natrinema sp. J7-2]
MSGIACVPITTVVVTPRPRLRDSPTRIESAFDSASGFEAIIR